ncbi:neurogenic locus notch homolog protein 4 [Exaiptasia diaphana]|uniref:EGF-like domain-containing protein n=1 Tax=Exaiptasia diaphana TaxID=2652724 RepID=A0A913XGN3_EXADI|nr:neurogenic locus notch homolog protein 4 [Exaiptasia diaphana]KXJ26166.1 Versican core protein [Exaiptasia diaphana]
MIMMIKLLLVIFCISPVVITDEIKVSDDKCPVKFLTYFCSKTTYKGIPMLTEMKFSDRDASKVGWKNWESYMADLVCRCAKAAKKSGQDGFGIQFYGECWTNTNPQIMELIHSPEGLSYHLLMSDQCVGEGYKPCPKLNLQEPLPNDKYCVGQANTYFFYQIGDICTSNPCNNGGTCISSGGLMNFKCLCKPNFFGRLCESTEVS